MTGNVRIVMAMIGSLVIGAGGMWWLTRVEAPPVAAAPSDSGQPAVAPAVSLPAQGSATDMPVAPTLVHSPALQGDPAGEYVIGAGGEPGKAMDMAAILVGSPDGTDAMRRATYRVTLGGAQRRSVTVMADVTLGVVVRDDESGQEEGRIGGVCYTKRHGAVFGCKRGDEKLLLALHWMHRGLLVRPLLDSPWRVAKAGALRENGRLVNTVELEVPGLPVSGASAALVRLDSISRRLLSVAVQGRRGVGPSVAGKEDPSNLGSVDLEFSEPRIFAGLLLSGTIRVSSTVDDPNSRDVMIHVIEVAKGSTVPDKAPAPALPKGLVHSARLAVNGLVFEVGSHDKWMPQVDKLCAEVLHDGVVDQFELVEALGPLGGAMGEAVQLWMVPRWSSALASPGVQPHMASLPIDTKVVGRFAWVSQEEVLAEASKVLAEVERAGLKPKAGRRTTVTYLDREAAAGRVLVLIEVSVD